MSDSTERSETSFLDRRDEIFRELVVGANLYDGNTSGFQNGVSATEALKREKDTLDAWLSKLPQRRGTSFILGYFSSPEEKSLRGSQSNTRQTLYASILLYLDSKDLLHVGVSFRDKHLSYVPELMIFPAGIPIRIYEYVPVSLVATMGDFLKRDGFPAHLFSEGTILSLSCRGRNLAFTEKTSSHQGSKVLPEDIVILNWVTSCGVLRTKTNRKKGEEILGIFSKDEPDWPKIFKAFHLSGNHIDEAKVQSQIARKVLSQRGETLWNKTL